MCGIVGALSSGNNVVPILIEGLKRLEYRGYDSAGVAVINGKLQRIRSVGRVADLEMRVTAGSLAGHIGIAHTRWATHGAPSERNAHPHVSGGISVVHNGIIENHDEIRQRLCLMGYTFTSETDTEVIAHLIHAKLRHGASLLTAVRQCIAELKGAYAIAVISDANATEMVVARNGSPLLLGIGDNATYAASDSAALASVTRRIIYLEDGDCAEISANALRIVGSDGVAVTRPVREAPANDAAAGLGSYRHYMQKEIFEQPLAVTNTLDAVARHDTVPVKIFGTQAEHIFRASDAVLILACGTSYHAAMVARQWIESIAGLPCHVEIASEYRYRDPVSNPAALVVTISQSGETADTLAALRYAMLRGHHASLCICNVAESSLMRASDLGFLTQAGPEIGVASTKAFTTQLVALALLVMVLAKQRQRLPRDREMKLLQELRQLPVDMCHFLDLEPQIQEWAARLSGLEHALFLGRGIHYPIAMEGALKLKEISYIHAEAYAAGELKHGPLALVNSAMPVVAIAPKDALIEKLKSNLQEVRARGGELYVLANPHTRVDPGEGIHVIHTPDHASFLSPILHTLPLQLLAYHTAVLRNNDVDKPRNLAKSVTVE